MGGDIILGIAAVVFVAPLLVVLIIRLLKDYEPPHRRAGRRGERVVSDAIRELLWEDDYLFTNVSVSYDNRPAEFDNIIVNRYGVFIIEVKNYVGCLYGKEDDFEWTKQKTTEGGYTYVKTVKNPIKQVRRQTDILARYLRDYGVRVWVEGYAYLIHGNSPIESPYLLKDRQNINKTIHTFRKNRLDELTVKTICDLLADCEKTD